MDFIMHLLSAFWKSINKKARFVVSLGIRWMAWSLDDDEIALWNFGDFGRFIRMRRSKINQILQDIVGTGFLKANKLVYTPYHLNEICMMRDTGHLSTLYCHV